MSKINCTRLNSDVNGNPRYVCHFLNLIPDLRAGLVKGYDVAVKRANKIGGRRFHNKQYGGGIAFTSYNIDGVEESIAKLIEAAKAEGAAS